MEADPIQIDTEPNKPSFRERIEGLPRNLLIAVLASLFVLFCLIAALIYSQTQSRLLKPERPSATPNQTIVDGQPIVLSFAELNSNASEYQNKWVQVTGNYFPKPPTVCNPLPTNGPQFTSVLVSDGLQLNIQGAEKALAIIAVNTEMVVEGIWRKYVGPVGCGKEPETAVIWYLDIQAIIQPNPVVGSTPLPVQATLPADLLPPGFGTPSTPGSEIPTPSNTPIPVTVVFETPFATNTPTQETLFFTPTALATPIATPTIGTFTRTPTPDPNATATTTATVTVTGTPPTPNPNSTPLPSIPTATNPSGYPGFPTSTPGGGYP